MKLIWKGDALREDIITAIINGLTEFGLTHETAAKGQLSPGRGVLTGTLRRSIHAASPSYNFGNDDTPPRPGSPERGGQGLDVSEKNGRIAVAVGSGMRYASRIEDMYGYIKQGHDQIFGRLPDIVKKHAAKQGLT